MKTPEGVRKVNIITTLANQIVAAACGIVVPRLLLGAFGSERYGITVSIAQFLSYITLLESGVGGVARAELYSPLARGDRLGVSEVYHAVKQFFLYVAVAFVLYSIVLGLLYYDVAHVTTLSRTYIFFLVLVIGLSTLAKYMGGLANLTLIVADQKQYVNNAISIGITLANTVAVILLISLNCELIWVKLGSSLIFIMRPLLYSCYVRKHYYLPKVEKKQAVLVQKWTGIGQHIAYFLHTNTDIVLLTFFTNTRMVAVYSVYSLVISNIRAITESFSGGMEAAFGEMIAKDQSDQLRRAFCRYKTLLTAVCSVLFGCTGILIVPFVRLYTKGITDADYIQPGFAIVLLLAEAINCLMLPYTSLPIAANYLKQTRWGAYGEAIFNIAISCILIQWEPLLGVAIGTLAATIFRGIFYMSYSLRHILCLPIYRSFLQFAGAIGWLCIEIVCGRFVLSFINIENYFQWVLCGVVVFAVLCLPVASVYFFINRERHEQRNMSDSINTDDCANENEERK